MSRQIDEELGQDTNVGLPSDWRPLARPSSEFSMCEVGDGEMTLLDLDRLEYHTLSKSAFATWRLCDGVFTLAELAELRYGLDTSDPHLAATEWEIIELHEAGLLTATELASMPGSSRRRILQLAAAALTGGIVIPAVKSVTVPDAASATSNVPNYLPCAPGDTCLSGPTSSGATGPYCCAYGGEVFGHRCISQDLAGTSYCTPVGQCGPWGVCQ